MPSHRTPTPYERALDVTAANPKLGQCIQGILIDADALKGRALRVAELLADGGLQAHSVAHVGGGRRNSYVTGASFEDGVDWLDEVDHTLKRLLGLD